MPGFCTDLRRVGWHLWYMLLLLRKEANHISEVLFRLCSVLHWKRGEETGENVRLRWNLDSLWELCGARQGWQGCGRGLMGCKHSAVVRTHSSAASCLSLLWVDVDIGSCQLPHRWSAKVNGGLRKLGSGVEGCIYSSALLHVSLTKKHFSLGTV